MEDRFVHSVDGQEVEQSDINSVSSNAARADDYVLAELFRVPPYESAVQKRIIPFGVEGVSGGFAPYNPVASVVSSSGAANATVNILPFRAIVGSKSGLISVDAWRAIDSRVVVPLGNTVQLAATASNPRWDLIYVRIDVDADKTSSTRYVKSPTTAAVAQQSIATKKEHAWTIGVVQGTEAATPARPALPADSGNQYYIPLAYVLLPSAHALNVLIQPFQIHEVAPCANISRVTGAISCRPANQAHAVGGTQLTQEDWAGVGNAPNGYLPSTMVGGEELIIPMSWQTGRETGHALNTNTLVDDSRDWRNRLWKWMVQGSDDEFAWWYAGPALERTPGFQSTGHVVGTNVAMGMGQSFFEDSGGPASGGSVIAGIEPTWNLSDMAASSGVYLYVDQTTGALRVQVNATNPGLTLFWWLTASAPFANHQT